LKYEARISVKQAYTLRGIMDETGLLEEGQIFCTVDKDGKPAVIAGNELIFTRSPALHPGDVRAVQGVNFPLLARRFSICATVCVLVRKETRICRADFPAATWTAIYVKSFSMPERDLARYWPQPTTQHPQPVDIGRTVTRQDMTDFFVTLMATDQLGRMANQHQILADQRPQGVRDPDCIKVAELNPVAVDFSKSGIPIDLTQFPRPPGCRPDFMAAGASAVFGKDKSVSFAGP
jgi:hypothetical protein